MKAIIKNGVANKDIQSCLISAKIPYTLIAQLRFLPRVVNSRFFRVPWSVKIVVHF